MALDATKFATVSGGAQQVHNYKTADAIATVTGAGYFNGITSRVHQHDVINVVSSTGGTVALDSLVVTSATGAAVVAVSVGS